MRSLGRSPPSGSERPRTSLSATVTVVSEACVPSLARTVSSYEVTPLS